APADFGRVTPGEATTTRRTPGATFSGSHVTETPFRIGVASVLRRERSARHWMYRAAGRLSALPRGSVSGSDQGLHVSSGTGLLPVRATISVFVPAGVSASHRRLPHEAIPAASRTGER